MNISSHWQALTTLTEGIESTWIRPLTGLPILRSASCPTIERACYHPSPGCIRLVRALLKDGDRSRSYIAQFKPANARHTSGTYRKVSDH